MMGLESDELLQMVKPAFGDSRAPRQWYNDAESTMKRFSFQKHQLEPCAFISTRTASADEADAYEDGQEHRLVDGIMALHVDDFIGGGEGVNSLKDIEGNKLGKKQKY